MCRPSLGGEWGERGCVRVRVFEEVELQFRVESPGREPRDRQRSRMKMMFCDLP